MQCKVKYRRRKLELDYGLDVLVLAEFLLKDRLTQLIPQDAVLPKQDHERCYRDILTIKFFQSINRLKHLKQITIKTFFMQICKY